MLNCSEASLGYRPLFTGGLCDFFFCFVQFLQADHLILGILQSQIIFFKILIGVQYDNKTVSALPRFVAQGHPVHRLIRLPAEIFRLLPKLLPGGGAGQGLVRPDGRA